MFGIKQFSKGYFVTTEGDYDGSVLCTDEAGMWVIPYEETDPIFVEWDKVQAFTDKAFGGLDPDSEFFQLMSDDYK